MLLTTDVCLQIFFLLLLLSMWSLFSLFFSNPSFYLSDSLFPLLHLPVLFYTYSCCVPCFILDSVVFVCFPSLFLLSSLESYISFSSFSVTNSCPLFMSSSLHHRYCTNFLFFFITVTLSTFCALTVEAGRNVHGLLLFSLPPLPDTFCFTFLLHLLLLTRGVVEVSLLLPPLIRVACNQRLTDFCSETSWEDTGTGQENKEAELTPTFHTSGKMRPRTGAFCRSRMQVRGRKQKNFQLALKCGSLI